MVNQQIAKELFLLANSDEMAVLLLQLYHGRCISGKPDRVNSPVFAGYFVFALLV
jgi:hypothetical protein